MIEAVGFETILHWIVLLGSALGVIWKFSNLNKEHVIRETKQEMRLKQLESDINRGSGSFGEIRSQLTSMQECLARIDERLKHIEERE